VRRIVLLAGLLVACGGKHTSASKYASAGVTAGLGVAAAGIYRASTGGCWADCRPGTTCDEPSGTCVPLPCGGDCPAGTHCFHEGSEDRCIPADGDGRAEAPAQGQPDGGVAETDACRGLCLRGESCAVQNGVADCVPAGR
jgi:hypothetical protein